MTETLKAGEGFAGAREWREGWGVVLAATIGVALGGIHYHFIGTMIRPFEAAYGWGRAEVVFGLTIISYLGPLTNVAAGVFVDRYGARLVALSGITLWAISFFVMGLAGPAVWSWYAACSFYAVAHLGVSAVVWTSLVVKRFSVQRGFALAMSLIGGGLMVAITPTLVVNLVEQTGTRGVFFTIACAGFAVMLVPTYCCFREASPGVAPATADPRIGRLPGHTRREALLSRQFWQLAVGLLLISACVGTFLVHIQPMLTDSGLTPEQAALVALYIGPAMVAGRLVTGFLFDRLDPRFVSGVAFLLPVVASALVMKLDGSYLVSALAGIFIGLSLGAEVDVVAYMTSRYFGLSNYGFLFAVLVSLYNFGVGTGSVVAGAFYDYSKSYETVVTMLGAGCLLATALVITIGRPPLKFTA